MATPGRGEQTGGVPASLVSIVIPTRNYADYVGQARVIAPGMQASETTHFFAGAKLTQHFSDGA